MAAEAVVSMLTLLLAASALAWTTLKVRSHFRNRRARDLRELAEWLPLLQYMAAHRNTWAPASRYVSSPERGRAP